MKAGGKKGSRRVLHTRFLESSDSDINKLVVNAVPESTRKSAKHAVNVFKVKKVMNTLKRFNPTRT